MVDCKGTWIDGSITAMPSPTVCMLDVPSTAPASFTIYLEPPSPTGEVDNSPFRERASTCEPACLRR